MKFSYGRRKVHMNNLHVQDTVLMDDGLESRLNGWSYKPKGE